MVRTQVHLTSRQLKALRQISAATRKSVAELVRQGVDRYLAGRIETGQEGRIGRAIAVAGAMSAPNMTST